ncbi:MAG: tyrosine-protein phosphatase [Hyphomicrobiales bacterium]
MGPSVCLARLLPVTVVRLTEDAVEIRWSQNARGLDLSVFRGDSPESIDTNLALAHVTEGSSILLTDLGKDSPHFFKLVSADGSELLAGERRPFVEGCPNLRDLGGYETADTRRVKWGLVFRSSNLNRLTDKGLGQIKRLGIKTVCDFRTEAEALKQPNRFPGSEAVPYVRLPIQHGDFEPTLVFDRIRNGDYGWISEDFMLQGYIDSVERYPGVWARLFGLLAEPGNRPMLFHCTGGKDRTGVAAALVLMALGVPEETVVADYGLSDGYNSDIRRKINDALRPLGVDISKVQPYFTAPKSRIRGLLQYVDDRYRSVIDYLIRKVGVSERLLDGLKADLLE